MGNSLLETGLAWDLDELDASDAAPPQARAKALVRRTQVLWADEDGSWHATIGRWNAWVSRSPKCSSEWEWRAFSVQKSGPRAVGGMSWSTREAAQLDAEKTLAELD